MLYLNKLVDGIYIDGAYYTADIHHVWGPYDEIGLLVGCPRQPYEKNRDYVYRLRETYQQFGNSSDQKLRNYIYRTLIPFTSQLPKDVIEFVELTPDFVANHMQDGTPDNILNKYFELAKEVNQHTDNSYWSIIDQRNIGLKMLPISWSLSLDDIDGKFIQNGVLRNSDLELSAPTLTDRPDKIDYIIHARKQSDETVLTYPETPFEFSLVHQEEKEGSYYGSDEGQVIAEDTVFRITAHEKINLEFDVNAKVQYTNIGSITFQDDENDVIITHVNDKDKTKQLVTKLVAGESVELGDSCQICNGSQVRVKDEESDQAYVIINLRSAEEDCHLVNFGELIIVLDNDDEKTYTISAQNLFENCDAKYNLYFNNGLLRLAKDRLYVQHNTVNAYNNGKYTNTSFQSGKGIGLDLKKDDIK